LQNLSCQGLVMAKLFNSSQFISSRIIKQKWFSIVFCIQLISSHLNSSQQHPSKTIILFNGCWWTLLRWIEMNCMPQPLKINVFWWFVLR
jgi:hypothetical protein